MTKPVLVAVRLSAMSLPYIVLVLHAAVAQAQALPGPAADTSMTA